jgi:ketosteroid isomerase-like protein
MSQENVEKVRAWLATWDREILRPETRPFERINSMAFGTRLCAPDAVYEDGVLPDHAGEPYPGLDRFNRAGETWTEQFEWMEVEMERIIDADKHVVSLHDVRRKMLHTGIEFEEPLAYVSTFQGGKVVHIRACADHTEALKAVGLQVEGQRGN